MLLATAVTVIPWPTLSRSQKICGHLDLIKPIAAGFHHQYGNLQLSRADLEQAGAVGLIRAVDRDDGRNFPALAKVAIRCAILDAIRNAYQAAQCERQETGEEERCGRPAVAALALKPALAELPPAEREVLRSRLEGYSMAEIAERTGMKPRKVRSIEHRGVARLKARYSKPQKAAA